jgi:hypothetical protein
MSAEQQGAFLASVAMWVIFTSNVYRLGVGIAMGYRLDGPGSIPGMATVFSFPQRPDRLWGPPSLLSS